LDTIGKSLGGNKLAAVVSRIDLDLWLNLDSSLQECTTTLGKMNQILQNINKKQYWGLDIMKKARKQSKLKSKTKALLDFKQQVHSHYSSIQVALQTINV
jgi:hypothetical protein